MPDYNKYGFKNKLVDRFQNDTIPPTYKRFNVPLYTGPKLGTKQDSTSYEQGFTQGIKNFQKGDPNAIAIRDAVDHFYYAGKIDGVDAAKKAKKKNK